MGRKPRRRGCGGRYACRGWEATSASCLLATGFGARWEYLAAGVVLSDGYAYDYEYYAKDLPAVTIADATATPFEVSEAPWIVAE